MSDLARPLREAILTVGSRRKLASLIGVTGQAIAAWDRIPAERVTQVEQATGISRQELRPDLYGPSVAKPQKLTGISNDVKLRDATRRAAARAIHSLLARDPDILGDHNALILARRLGTMLHDELMGIIESEG